MENESLKLVVFTLENDETIFEYGFPITQVQEITRQGKTIKMPDMPDFVEGMMNLRGNVIPIIDLKRRFRLGTSVKKDTTRIVVVNLDNKKCGIVVDDVSDIIAFAAEEIETIPSFGEAINSNYIIGIGKVDERLVTALDVKKILTEKEEEAVLSPLSS